MTNKVSRIAEENQPFLTLILGEIMCAGFISKIKEISLTFKLAFNLKLSFYSFTLDQSICRCHHDQLVKTHRE